jgi:hypothetical protein
MKTATVRGFRRNRKVADRKQQALHTNSKSKFVVRERLRPRMTRKLAEARAIGDPKGSKFDGTAFLVSLKK